MSWERLTSEELAIVETVARFVVRDVQPALGGQVVPAGGVAGSSEHIDERRAGIVVSAKARSLRKSLSAKRRSWMSRSIETLLWCGDVDGPSYCKCFTFIDGLAFDRATSRSVRADRRARPAASAYPLRVALHDLDAATPPSSDRGARRRTDVSAAPARAGGQSRPHACGRGADSCDGRRESR